MASKEFDTKTFVDGLIGLKYLDVRQRLDREISRAEGLVTGGVNGAPHYRSVGVPEYVASLKALSFLFTARMRPVDKYARMDIYEPLVRSLTEAGEIDPSIFALYSTSS